MASCARRRSSREAPEPLRHPPGQPSHVIYTTPLKALSNQKFHDLRRRYGEPKDIVTAERSLTFRWETGAGIFSASAAQSAAEEGGAFQVTEEFTRKGSP